MWDDCLSVKKEDCERHVSESDLFSGVFYII